MRLAYLLGGALYVIGAQEVYYTGAGSMKTFLPPLPYFLGMMLSIMLPPPGEERPASKATAEESSKIMIKIATLEATGYIMTYLGISYAGSTIFTIVYGCMSLVVAMVRWLLTGKVVLRGQFVGMLIAVLGICSTAFEGFNAPEAASTELGVFFTLVGCFAYATEYVFLEEALSMMPTTTVLYTLGKYCSVLFLTLFLTIGLPHHKAWIEDQVAAHHGRIEIVFLLYVMMIPCSFFKNYAWLGVIRGDGAVTTGLMQGCRSVLTFTLSATLFCSEQNPNQCFSMYKVCRRGGWGFDNEMDGRTVWLRSVRGALYAKALSQISVCVNTEPTLGILLQVVWVGVGGVDYSV